MIWFEEREEARLKDFVANDLKAEIALNSVCAEIVNMVLESDELRRIAQNRIDSKSVQKTVGSSTLCVYCGLQVTGWYKDIHEASCDKRPLLVITR